MMGSSHMLVKESKRFEAVGACIYCGASEDLTDEHVIPFALGGKLILPDSSCKDCAAITSRFEMLVLRGFMLPARTVGGFPTRRPRQRPSKFNLEAEIAGKDEVLSIDTEDFPAILQLPVFRPPGILEGRDDGKQFSVVGVHTIRFGDHPLALFKQLLAKRIKWKSAIPIGPFTQFLAKIAYSYSVGVTSRVQLDKTPVLPYIRGEADDGSRWIGSSDFPHNASLKGATHTMKLVQHTTNQSDQGLLESVQLRLFSNSGGPGYEVVVRVP